jgi:hypothetical protein
MTVAEELWNDKVWVNKRYADQCAYISGLSNRDISEERRLLLLNSAEGIRVMFEKRLKELNRIKCRCEDSQDRAFCDFWYSDRCNGRFID